GNLNEVLANASTADSSHSWTDDEEGDANSTQDLSSTLSLKLNGMVENLSQAIAAAGRKDLAAIIKTMSLLSFPRETMVMTLGYDMSTLPINDLMAIQEPKAQQTLQDTVGRLWPNATLNLAANEPTPEETARGRYRIATGEEQRQLADNPFVKRVNQLFDAVVIEARIKT
ncbi:MAG: hypothetical protein PHC30_02540, partial [Lentisphaeria bacterium]|nr:hypothetical protein [Lentisphaeria bacterium]